MNVYLQKEVETPWSASAPDIRGDSLVQASETMSSEYRSKGMNNTMVLWTMSRGQATAFIHWKNKWDMSWDYGTFCPP